MHFPFLSAVAIVFIKIILCDDLNWGEADAAAVLSAYAFCNSDLFLTQNYFDECDGFKVTYQMEKVEGFVGFLQSQSAIFIIFGSSKSVEDWVFNLNILQTDYPNCNDCKVHEGFYTSEKLEFLSILYATQKLQIRFPTFKVIVAGHSKGAAVATLTALDLQELGISPIIVFSFGSPRISTPLQFQRSC